MILILIQSTLSLLDTRLSQYLCKQPIWSNISIHLDSCLWQCNEYHSNIHPLFSFFLASNKKICLSSWLHLSVCCLLLCTATAQWAFLILHGHRQVNKTSFNVFDWIYFINLPKNALRPTVKYRTRISILCKLFHYISPLNSAQGLPIPREPIAQ